MGFVKLSPLVLLLVVMERGEAKKISRQGILNLPELNTERSVLRGVAWTTSNYAVQTTLTSCTACIWAKSSDLSKTGTLFTYYTNKTNLQFGLVSTRLDEDSNPAPRDQQSSNITGLRRNATRYDLRLVVRNQISTKPVLMRLDDAVWHDVCVTWSSSGAWQLFLDGHLEDGGRNFQVGERISSGGRIFFGSAIEAEDHSGYVPFNGKLTGFSLWDSILPLTLITRVAKCNNFKGRQQPSWLYDFSSSSFDQLRSSLIYNWSPSGVKTKWPAAFQSSKNICAKEVTVDCSHNRMIITMATKRFLSRDLKRANLHLNDHSCVPTVRGQKKNRFVFDVEDFQSCGMQRKVTNKDVIYINHVSNSPGKQGIVFSNFIYTSQIRCYYPIDLTVSTTLIDPDEDNQFIFRTPMVHPKTNTKDIEATVMMFEDGAFSQSITSSPQLQPDDDVYVGIVVKNTTDQSPVDDVNVVLDRCWVTSQNLKHRVMDNKGCWTDDDVTILENGQRSQGRLKLSSRVFAVARGPVFLLCSTHPCVGDSCTPSCGSNTSASSFINGFDSTTWNANKHISRRDVNLKAGGETPEEYEIRIGPIYVQGFDHPEEATPVNESNEENAFSSSPAFIAIVAVLSVVVVSCLVVTIAIVQKKVLNSRRYEVARASEGTKDTCPYEVNEHRFTSFSQEQITTISSSLTSSVTSLSSFESCANLSDVDLGEIPSQSRSRNFYILV